MYYLIEVNMAERALELPKDKIPEESSISGLTKCDFHDVSIWRFDIKKGVYPKFITDIAKDHAERIPKGNSKLHWFCSRYVCQDMAIIPPKIEDHPYLWITYLSYLFFEYGFDPNNRQLEMSDVCPRDKPLGSVFLDGVNSILVWIIEKCPGYLHYDDDFFRSVYTVTYFKEKIEYLETRKRLSVIAMFLPYFTLSESIFIQEAEHIKPFKGKALNQLYHNCGFILGFVCCIEIDQFSMKRLGKNLMLFASRMKEVGVEAQGAEIAGRACKMTALGADKFEVIVNKCEFGADDRGRIMNVIYRTLGIIPDWDVVECIFDQKYFEHMDSFDFQKVSSGELKYHTDYMDEIKKLQDEGMSWCDLKWSHLTEGMVDKMVEGWKIEDLSVDSSAMACEYSVDGSVLMCKCKNKKVRNFVLRLSFAGLESFYEFESIKALHDRKDILLGMCNKLEDFQLGIVIQGIIDIFIIYMKEGIHIDNLRVKIIVELFDFFYRIYETKTLDVSSALHLDESQQSMEPFSAISNMRLRCLELEASNRELKKSNQELRNKYRKLESGVVDLEEKMKNLLSLLQSRGILGDAQSDQLFCDVRRK